MRLPMLNKVPRSKQTVYNFKGLDKRQGAGEACFSDMLNMSGDSSGCISSRRKRGSLDLGGDSVYSMVTTDVLIDGRIRENAFIVDGGSRLRAYYYEDGQLKSTAIMNTSGFTTGKNKMIASGGYLYFFPDKKYINLMNLRDLGSLEAKVELPLGAQDNRYFQLCLDSTDAEGKALAENSGYIRIKCAKYKYDDASIGEYIADVSFTTSFNVGDVVDINGGEVFSGSYKISYLSDSYDYMVVNGYMEENPVITDGTLTVSRNIPDMDYVIAAGNRLWGCKYGVNDKGEPVNEIYASRLGDPKNWHSYDGISTDSYTASLGVDGVFTGAVVYGDDPHFFKEDAVIRIYGDAPSNFSVVTRNIRGIEKGSSESAVLVDDTLFYKTYSGIVAYNGGMPYNVDRALGDEIYKKATAGAVGGKYYVSMENTEGERELLVYNTLSGLWYKEDDLSVRGFCRAGNELYMLTGDPGENSIISALGSGNAHYEDEVSFSVTSGEMDYLVPSRKYVSKLSIKCQSEKDLWLGMYISYDGEDKWHKVGDKRGDGGVITFSVKPRRCDSFRLKLSGRGEVSIISILRIESRCGDYR